MPGGIGDRGVDQRSSVVGIEIDARKEGAPQFDIHDAGLFVVVNGHETLIVLPDHDNAVPLGLCQRYHVRTQISQGYQRSACAVVVLEEYDDFLAFHVWSDARNGGDIFGFPDSNSAPDGWPAPRSETQ